MENDSNPNSQQILDEIIELNCLIHDLQSERKRLKKLLTITEQIEALQLARTHKILFGDNDDV